MKGPCDKPTKSIAEQLRDTAKWMRRRSPASAPLCAQLRAAADHIESLESAIRSGRERWLEDLKAARDLASAQAERIESLESALKHNRACWAEDLEIAGEPLLIHPGCGAEIANHVRLLLDERDRLVARCAALEAVVDAARESVKAVHRPGEWAAYGKARDALDRALADLGEPGE